MQNTTTKYQIENLKVEIADLGKKEYVLATNAGTYSDHEALEANGHTSEPRYNDRTVYVTVSGIKRTKGADADSAPGRMVQSETWHLDQDRIKFAELRKQYAKLTR